MALVRPLPAFRDYLRGGTKLKENYNKKTSLDIVAESWELSIHKDGQSIVDNGEYRGLALSEYAEKLGKDILDTKGNAFESFPILAKFTDAKGNLSIQAYPDNKYVLRVEEGYGKTEMWYTPGAERGVSLYYGTNKEATEDEFQVRTEGDTTLDVLKKVPVHKGNVFPTESGAIHAIGEGIVICEVQQNSNTTYRVYGFGCAGKDGKPRELHIEKAIGASNLIPLEGDFRPIGEKKDYGTYKCAMMAACEYFTTYAYDVKTECGARMDEESLASFVIMGGEGGIKGDDTMLSIRKGDSVFASADMGKVTIKGSCRFILSKI